MESPSAPARRGRLTWQGLLLAVPLLTFSSPPSTAQLTVVSVNATEGKDVLLLVLNLPGNLFGYGWYRGESADGNREIAAYVIDSQETTPGPTHSGRETIYSNGSLLFQNITLNDTGYYTVQTINRNLQTEAATGKLHVYRQLPKPSITSNNSNPEEHKDSVLLTCEPETQDTTYLWFINSQSLQDGRTLTLLHVTRNDTGPYECEIRNPVSASRSDPFTLNVLYGPDAPSIVPSDSHYPAGTNLRLSCHAASNPPAQYSWLFNGTLQQPTQELFIPSITADGSGSYTCLVHNSVGLSRTTVRTITVTGDSTSPTSAPSGGAIAGISIGVMAVVALTAALGASDQHDVTDHRPSASNHSQRYSETSSDMIHEVTYSYLNFSAQEAKRPTSASPSPVDTEMIYSVVKKK